MKKILLLIAALAVYSPAYAADNAVTVTVGAGVTLKSKDVGAGVQAMQPSLVDTNGNEVLGTVTASPTANTIGDRLKTINTTLGTPMQATGGTVTANAGTNLNTGAAGDTACATDTGSCSINALLQRIAQRITTAYTSIVLGAGENHAGEVGGNLTVISTAITTSNNSVTTGKSIGGTLTLTGAVRVSGSIGASGTSGIIQNVSLFFKDAVTTPNSLDIYWFNASPSSTCTDNTSFALSASDLAKVIGITHMTDFTASNTGVIGQGLNQSMGFGLASATSLFACIVTRGTFAITTTSGAELLTNIMRN